MSSVIITTAVLFFLRSDVAKALVGLTQMNSELKNGT
jgi:hypothetical protein